jgi:hypothetical protein
MGFCAEQRLAGLPRARIAACIPGTDRQGKKKNLERPLRAMATFWDATPGRGRRTNAAHSPPCRPQHTKPKWALLTPSNGPGAVPYATCPGQGQQMEGRSYLGPGGWGLMAYVAMQYYALVSQNPTSELQKRHARARVAVAVRGFSFFVVSFSPPRAGS